MARHAPTPDPSIPLRVRRGQTLAVCETCREHIAETTRRAKDGTVRHGWRHLGY